MQGFGPMAFLGGKETKIDAARFGDKDGFGRQACQKERGNKQRPDGKH